MEPVVKGVDWVLENDPRYVGLVNDPPDPFGYHWLYWYEDTCMTRMGQYEKRWWSPGMFVSEFEVWLEYVYSKLGKALPMRPGPDYCYIPDSQAFKDWVVAHMLGSK